MIWLTENRAANVTIAGMSKTSSNRTLARREKSTTATRKGETVASDTSRNRNGFQVNSPTKPR